MATCTGVAFGHDTVGPKIAAAVVPAIQKCWSMPALAEGERPHVQLRLRFNPDATLAGKPEIVESAQGSNAEAFVQSTVSAVARCQPYRVLLDFPHERWREIVVNFDPPPP